MEKRNQIPEIGIDPIYSYCMNTRHRQNCTMELQSSAVDAYGLCFVHSLFVEYLIAIASISMLEFRAL